MDRFGFVMKSDVFVGDFCWFMVVGVDVFDGVELLLEFDENFVVKQYI